MIAFLYRSMTALVLVVICFGLYQLPTVYSSLFIAALLLIILSTEWPVLAKHKLSFWLFSPIYPVLPFIMFISLNQDPACRPLLGLALLLSAAHDTASYVVGKLVGRHRIAPTISAGKTWEGFFGGLIFTMLVFMSVIFYLHAPVPGYVFLALSVTISLTAFFGDLFESWLKRKAGVKDSGSLLPGHGGLLDRLDSVLFVIVFVYLCKKYLCCVLL